MTTPVHLVIGPPRHVITDPSTPPDRSMLRRSFPPPLGIVSLLMASAVVGLPSPAAAQPAPAEQATNSQGEYRKAHEAARLRNWPEARRILLGLWSKAKTYDVAASLSEAEYALGHPAASAQYMDYALRNVTPNESATTVANMKSALEKIRPKVGSVKLTVSDPAAIVSVDGTAIEYDPKIEIFLEPGKHVLEASIGERKTSKAIQTVASETISIELELPKATSSLPPPGTPPVAPAPANIETVDAGPQPRTIALFVGGGLAVAGLGMGLGFGAASNSFEGDVEDYRGKVGSNGCQGRGASSADCGALADAVDSQRRNTHIANVGFGLAAVGLVTAGVALLWPRSAEPSTARASHLELRWAGNGISLGGKF